MKKQSIYKGIGILEMITGFAGAGFLVWAMTSTHVVAAAPVLYPVYLAFALLFVLAGALLFKGNVIGIWLSILCQLIAMPSYTSGDYTFAFNNVLRFFVYLSTNEAVVGIDLVAVVLFFYLAMSLPSSSEGVKANNG